MSNKVRLEKFTGLPLLKYLQLDNGSDQDHGEYRYGKLSSSQIEMDRKFREWIMTMKSLQTLDLRLASHGDLTSIWEIKTLRHIEVSQISAKATKGPSASANLPDLQTLNGVISTESWEQSGLPKIPEVRELDIKLVGPPSWKVIVAVLDSLKHLVSLSMSGTGIQIQNFEGIFQNSTKLNYMNIRCIEEKPTLELKDNMLAPNLIELSLEFVEFTSDPMPVLQKLHCLEILTFYKTNRSHLLNISCSASGFQQLQTLSLIEISMMQQWKIELGAMPRLARLNVKYCGNLPVPPELIHLKNLQFLHWRTEQRSDVFRANNKRISEIFKANPTLRGV